MSESTTQDRVKKKAVVRLSRVIRTPLKIALDPNVSPSFLSIPFTPPSTSLVSPFAHSLSISSSTSRFLFSFLFGVPTASWLAFFFLPCLRSMSYHFASPTRLLMTIISQNARNRSPSDWPSTCFLQLFIYTHSKNSLCAVISVVTKSVRRFLTMSIC